MKRRILSISLVVFLVAPAHVAAWAANCSNYGNYFAGAFYDPSFNVHGVRADINTRQADLCTPTASSHPSASAAWVMLADDAGGGHAQIGYTKEEGRTRQYFTQNWRGGSTGATTKYYGHAEVDQKWQYKVYRFVNGDDHLHMVRCTWDTDVCVELFETGWDPLNMGTPTWGGIYALYSGETFHTTTHMPGSSSSKTNFSEISHKDNQGDWFLAAYAQNVTGGSGTGYRFEMVDYRQHFKIWND